MICYKCARRAVVVVVHFPSKQSEQNGIMIRQDVFQHNLPATLELPE